MKKTLLIIAALMVVVLSVSFAQTSIAVINFEGKGVTNVEASALTDRLRTELFNIGGYKVVERGMMEEILGELGYQQSGCTSDECIVEVGKHLGVEQMVGGSISKVGKTYSVSARIVSVETREIIKTATYDYRGEIDDLLTSGMRNVALKLTGQKDGKTEPAQLSIISAKKPTDTVTTVGGMDFIFVKGGTFQMGSNSGYNEKPVHSVTVSDFNISKTEVTFEQYDVFCDATGRDKPDDRGWGRGDRPVMNVSWHDVTAFCEWMTRTTGKTYRLPTEAEWEYAARGGNKSKGYKYSGGNDLDAVGWDENNSGWKTHPVAEKQSNELGLYDMSGNVREWCSDWYGDYSTSPQTDPQGPNSGKERVLRGGWWNSYGFGGDVCRVARRYRLNPDSRGSGLGFRLVLSQD
jgi:formylglycine-generating enzyme required for sulfatase activity